MLLWAARVLRRGPGNASPGTRTTRLPEVQGEEGSVGHGDPG
jgi:hypothetical protein